MCEVPGCGNIATATQGHRCTPHATDQLFLHWEEGPLPTPCLMVDGVKDRWDYGHAILNGKGMSAHRWKWTICHGPIPEGLQVLHRCDRPGCVELSHLFLGTQADNMADRKAKGHYDRKTHCLRGHRNDEMNTYFRKDRPGQRQCRACKREREQAA